MEEHGGVATGLRRWNRQPRFSIKDPGKVPFSFNIGLCSIIKGVLQLADSYNNQICEKWDLGHPASSKGNQVQNRCCLMIFCEHNYKLSLESMMGSSSEVSELWRFDQANKDGSSFS
ncbi:unnamed protein product [Urochloa humidicola]